MRIRSSTPKDAPAVDSRFGGRAEELIGEWSKRSYNGRFFEMLAVEDGGRIVGTVSLFEHSRSVVSLGVEIFEEFRRRGYGYEGCRLALERARGLGYAVAMDQVLASNDASAGLHIRLGFDTNI